MSGVPIDLACELLAASLSAWGLAGDARCTPDGAIAIDQTNNNTTIRVEARPRDAMFRWTVTIDGRTRPAISLSAVLRQVRTALDPDYAATRVRVSIAPLPVP
jgi:hypothetical protein